jgi:hypothetical protein
MASPEKSTPGQSGSLFVCCSVVTESVTDELRDIQKTRYASRYAAVAG